MKFRDFHTSTVLCRYGVSIYDGPLLKSGRFIAVELTVVISERKFRDFENVRETSGTRGMMDTCISFKDTIQTIYSLQVQ